MSKVKAVKAKNTHYIVYTREGNPWSAVSDCLSGQCGC